MVVRQRRSVIDKNLSDEFLERIVLFKLAARVLAVADIFEALSSSDRPYKKANSMAAVMRIIGFMVKDGHVDLDVCDLMVESGVVARYAREHLAEAQWGEFEWRGKKYTV